jgi:hypothetical protein
MSKEIITTNPITSNEQAANKLSFGQRVRKPVGMILVGAGLLGLGGTTLGACSAEGKDSTTTTATSSTTTTLSLTAEQVRQVFKEEFAKTTTSSTVAPETTTSTSEITTTTEAVEVGITFGDVKFIGFPEKVDAKDVDKADHAPFKNTIGLGSENVLAEPGVLLFGADAAADPKQMKAFNKAKASGAIEFREPDNDMILHEEGPFYQNLPAGQFVDISGGEYVIEIGHQDTNGDWVTDGMKIVCPQLDPEGGHNYITILRGSFVENKTLKITEYVPGHTQVQVKPKGAFFSEGQFLQEAQESHVDTANGTNSLTVAMIDVNPGSVGVINQTGVKGPWVFAGSNWFQPK